MESDEPVPFSEFGLKGRKDRHLRYVLRRLGNPKPGFYDYGTFGLARIWLSDVHGRWDSLLPDVKSRLVSDLLDALYRRKGGFDALFEILFLQPEYMGMWPHVDYSSTAADILRSFGMEHSFHDEGQFLNILDFPLKKLLQIHDIESFHETPCDRGCLCRSIGRPLYVSFFGGRLSILRFLLNSGASLMPQEVCRLDDLTSHPLTFVDPDVFPSEDDRKRLQDLVSLELVLVDATQHLRWNLRSKFPDVVEEVPSLKHVARACVRQCLRDSRTIGRPGVLETFGLPKSLESYIYMEEVVVDA